MANPTLADLTNEAALALSDTVDTSTGVRHQKFGVGSEDDPPVFARLMNLERKLFTLLSGTIGGRVVWTGTGLNVEAFAMEYALAGVAKSFAGNGGSPLALPASSTSYVYLDADATLKSQAGSWPAGDIVKLGKVVTNATQVTTITDMRLGPNLLIGIANAWWTVPPTATVDLDGQNLDNVANLGLADPVTVAPGSSGILNLTSQNTNLLIDTYNETPTDDVITMTGNVTFYGRLFVLRQANAARAVTIKESAFHTFAGDCVFDNPDTVLVLLEAAGQYYEVCRNQYTVSTLTQHVDADGYNLADVGMLSVKHSTSALTISSGTITVGDGSHYSVLNEAAAATDNLDTINGSTMRGQLLLLWAGNAGQVPTLRHGIGNLRLLNGRDYALVGTNKPVVLVTNGSYWVEVGRDLSVADLVDTANALPYPLGPFYIGGALAVAVLKINVFCKHAFTLVNARGIVGTAPSGGACIVDIRKNGSSIFADQGEMINIADGETAANSATKNAAFAVTDVMTFEVEAANSAADLTISIDAMIAPKTPPA